MSEISPTGDTILLVSDDDDLEVVVSRALKRLAVTVSAYPDAAIFVGAHIRQKLYAENAKKELDLERVGHLDPLLVIIDANIREDKTEMRVSDGSAASGLLDWLKKERPDLLVMVVGSNASDDMQRKVMSMETVSLWTLEQDVDGESGDLFVEALAGLALIRQKPKRRTIIDVGATAARYRVSAGRYQFVRSRELAYRDAPVIENLMETFDSYTPYHNGFPLPGSIDMLQYLGKFLFNAMLKDTVGKNLIDMLHPRIGPAEDDVEMRFEVYEKAPQFDRIFLLPFELVNDLASNHYLCSRVPMARSIRLEPGRGATDCGGSFLDNNSPLKILFLQGNADSDVRLEVTGQNERKFDRLKSVKDELKILDDLAGMPARRPFSTPKVVGDQHLSPLVGAALAKALEDELTQGKHDIFHFSGHSFSLGGKKGTYLILPGEPRGTAFPLPIEKVAKWMSRGGCHLMVLSSCEGASVLTAMEAMRGGAEGVIGFRWVVDAKLCSSYFESFYRSLLIEGRSLSMSFRDACNEGSMGIDKITLPTWASAVAVLRD